MKNEPTTTLAKIRAHSPCEDGYKKLCKSLGGIKKYGENTPITIRQIVESNELYDALWTLRTIPEYNNRWRLLAVRYARTVQHLMTDPRSLAAMDVAERHARGLATNEELSAELAAARAAADAADAARYAERYAERDKNAAAAAARAAAAAAARAADAALDAAWAVRAAVDTAALETDAAARAGWLALEAAVAEQTTMLIDICEGAENEE